MQQNGYVKPRTTEMKDTPFKLHLCAQSALNDLCERKRNMDNIKQYTSFLHLEISH